MTILYTTKILQIDEASSVIRFMLIPTNDPTLEPLRRRIKLSPGQIDAIEALPTAEEKLIACRAEMLKGDMGFQADWETQRATKNASVTDLLKGLVGHEFPVTTQEELDAINAPTSEPEPPEPDNKVIF